MKSGIQMNFLERRARADRALSQLVRMTRASTETLSSREQRGIYRLESTLLEKSSTPPPLPQVGSRAAFAARWVAFSTLVLLLVGWLYARARAYSQRISLARVRVLGQWLRKLVQRARCHWLLLASRR